MTSNTVVSVIIPFYNGEKHINETVQSILKQTFTNFELLIVNDGSATSSNQCLSNLSNLDSRIKVYNKVNGGVACARQFGINQATSDLIAFCDQDDLWLPTKLEKQVPLFTNPDVGLIFCGAIEDHITESRKVKLPFYETFRGNIFESLLQRNEIVSCTAVARKNLLLKVDAFDPDRNLMGVDDWLAWLKLSLFCKVDFVNEYLAIHVFHGTNYSSNELSMYKAERICLQKIKEFTRSEKLYSHFNYDQVELNIHSRYAESLIYTGEYKNGGRAYFRMFKIKPNLKVLLKSVFFYVTPKKLLQFIQKTKRKYQ